MVGQLELLPRIIQKVTLSELESHLWAAANILRGPIDQADFKSYIFPLLFYKRISDVYWEEFRQALDESGGDVEYARFTENHRFQIPEHCHWKVVHRTPKNIGAKLTTVLHDIEKANPDRLYGIFGDAPWANKERVSDEVLRALLEHFSSRPLTTEAVEPDMLGQAYEYLIKKFADLSNKKAGEFYTPRSVVKLLVEILDPKGGETVYDPACGRGGMLAITEERMKALNPKIRVELYGQELNGESFGICKSDMLVTGHNPEQIAFGNTLTEDEQWAKLRLCVEVAREVWGGV